MSHYTYVIICMLYVTYHVMDVLITLVLITTLGGYVILYDYCLHHPATLRELISLHGLLGGKAVLCL